MQMPIIHHLRHWHKLRRLPYVTVGSPEHFVQRMRLGVSLASLIIDVALVLFPVDTLGLTQLKGPTCAGGGGGGGEHCLFEGSYRLPNYCPRFFQGCPPRAFFDRPLFLGVTDHRPLTSNFLNANLYTIVTPIFP